jgi:hypothetical protein
MPILECADRAERSGEEFRHRADELVRCELAWLE